MFFILLTTMLLITSPFQVENDYRLTLGLNETIDPYIFGESSETLLSQLATIKTTSLGTTQLTLTMDDDTTSEWMITISNEQTWVTPKLGNHPLISYIRVENNGLVALDLYNPTIFEHTFTTENMRINEKKLPFETTFYLPPLEAISISFSEGEPSDVVQTTMLWDEPIVSISLLNFDEILDELQLGSISMSRYGLIRESSFHLYRNNKAIDSQTTYDPSNWMHRSLDESKRIFQLAQPTITPLEQAKRWAEFVMYGDGMLAAGRVEEAFRSLEREYLAMDPQSKELIFTQPNTIISGINESFEEDTSTFREAVGRYNYLAARVPGAEGLQNPYVTTFNFTAIILPSLGIGCLILFFLFLKKRQEVY